MVAADPYRPAAIKQLQTLGKQIDVPVFEKGDDKLQVICSEAISFAEKNFSPSTVVPSVMSGLVKKEIPLR